jgi:sulfur carrier protein
MIDIHVNGEARSVPPGTTVQELVALLALPDTAMALAINRSVVPRQQWGARQLAANDQVDIVRAIGGG